MKLKNDEKGQISAELILILASISIIILITAHITTSYLNNITAHIENVTKTGRDNVLSKL